MGFSDTFKKLVGIEEVDDEPTEADLAEARKEIRQQEEKKPPMVQVARPQVEVRPQQPSKVSMAGTNTFNLVVIEPKSFDDCPKLVDSLKGRRPVVINLESIETETAKKIFDFLSGATYALEGTVQKVANNIFIFAPASTNIVANSDERGFDFGQNKSPWRG